MTRFSQCFRCVSVVLIFAWIAPSGRAGEASREVSPVSVQLGLTQEYLAVVSGGIRRTGEYNALAALEIGIDLQRLIGWPGAHLHASGYAIVGSSLSAEAIGDDSNVSNINFRNSVRLFEAYLEQEFFGKRLFLRAGQLAADSEFFGTECGDAPGGGLFLDGDFGAPPILSANVPSPIYAIAALGMSGTIRPTDNTFVRIAIYDGNPAPDYFGSPDPQFVAGTQTNDHGLDFHLSSAEGFLAVGEVGVTTGSNRLPGSYKVGGYYHSGDFTRWKKGTAVSGDWAFYGIASQKIWPKNSNDAQGFYGYARVGFAPADRSVLDWTAEAGCNYIGVIPGRASDILGIGFSRKNYSRDLDRSLRRAGESGVTDQSILEITYQMRVTPGWTLQPDFQYVFRPAGRANLSDAAVLGIRISTVF